MRNYDEFKEELLRRKAEQKAKDRRKRRLIGSVCIILCLVIVASVVMRPTTKVQALNLMEGIEAQNVAGKEPDAAFRNAQYEFALELFKACRGADGENVLVSPLSVMLALSMTANGAKGETLRQMEEVLGLPIADLNAYFKTYVNQLPSNEKTKIHIANSVWFRDDEERLNVHRDFLQTNANYYGADAYAAPFDEQTLENINNWVSDNTDGMIDHILSEITDQDMMYLINAMYFDAKWEGVKPRTFDGKFHQEDGSDQNVTMLSTTAGSYLETDNATGFKKDYAGGDYQFVALLPNEGVTVEELLDSLTAEKLQTTLDGTRSTKVITHIPEFDLDYDVNLSDILRDLGMKDAFEYGHADFTGIGSSSDGDLYVGSVAHKTHITVNAEGTRAAATTIIDVPTADVAPIQPLQVILDRPFLYMIVDSENNLPLFIGTVDQVN